MTANVAALHSFSTADGDADAAALIATLDQQGSIPAIQRRRSVATKRFDVRLDHRILVPGTAPATPSARAGQSRRTERQRGRHRPSGQMLAEARTASGRNHVPVQFRFGDITSLPLPDAGVDGALCERVFPHFPTRRWPNSSGITRPGGRIVVIDTDWVCTAPAALGASYREDLPAAEGPEGMVGVLASLVW